MAAFGFGSNYRSYSNLDRISSSTEQPSSLKVAVCLAPTGLVALLLAVLLSSALWSCLDECGRTAQIDEDKLLGCIDQCEVQGKVPKSDCHKVCKRDTVTTQGSIHRAGLRCSKLCEGSGVARRVVAVLGAFAFLPVTPIIGSYAHSCQCDCCLGSGCSSRQSLFIVSWVLYALGCLVTLPATLEQSGDVGGKVLFSMSMVLSIVLMAGSRLAYDQQQLRCLNNDQECKTQHGPQLGGGGELVGAAVGSGLSQQELQEQVLVLQRQVADLLRSEVVA